MLSAVTGVSIVLRFEVGMNQKNAERVGKGNPNNTDRRTWHPSRPAIFTRRERPVWLAK